MSPEHIALLLVEDNAGDARLIQEILNSSRHARFTLTRVARLDEALARLKNESFDAALLDLTLPDSRGIATFQRLHQAAPSMPVVIMTGLDGEEAGVQAVKEGAQDYLVKGEPASEALIRTIRHAIERQSSAARLSESEENYHRLFDAVADPVVIFDLASRVIVNLNAAACALYGYERDELIGRDALILSAEPERSEASLQKLATVDAEAVPLRRHRRKDGSVFPVEIRVSAYEVNGRRIVTSSIRDITQRHHAEEEQRRLLRQVASEKSRLVEAQAVAKIGSWETSLTDLSVVWSEETYRIFECDPAMFTPTHAKFLGLIHPDDRARVDEAFTASLDKSGRFSVEHRVLLPSGMIKMVEQRWRIHLARDGKPARAIGTCQDVTERQVAQRLIEESHQRFQRMAESISQVFWMTDLDKHAMLYVSPAYAEIWGRSCENLYQNPDAWLDAILPEDREKVLAALPLQATGGYDVTYRIRRPDGALRWIRDRGFPVADKSGQAHQVTGVAQDITEQALAEAALYESQEFLEKAQEMAGTGSWVNPLNERDALVWSKHCRRIFGVEPDRRLVIADLFSLIHPDDREAFAAVREKALRESAPYTIEYRIVRPDGTLRWIRTKAEVIRNRVDGTLKIHGVIWDITERKENERRLKETEAMLAQAQKMESMGRLAGGVAHDFNNILTAILGLSEMSLLALPNDSPVREDLEEIRKAGLRAANLTQQLLAFSRRQVTSPRILNLDESIAGVAKMLRRIIGENVELVLEPGLDGVTVKADPGQIEQLVMNLVVNARDALAPGGRITIRTFLADLAGADAAKADLPEGPYVCLEVQDDGVGMSDEVKSRLFEPFFTTKEKGKGTGLGLATCYGVVKQNGGAIDCRSALGAGTTFRVLLPCARASAPPAAAARRTDLPKGGETVLVVEDEEPVRRLTTRILRGLGYAVLEAEDGAAALAVVKNDAKGEIRLILSDMVMPKMSGWDLSLKVQEFNPDLPVMFVSGYTDDVFESLCLIDDKTDILAKPYTAEELAARVRRALDRAPVS